MNKKEDRRILYTKMVLRESLLDILKSKPLSQVTVSEICRDAEVNRNTFYSHYDTPYDIMHEAEDELFETLMKDVENIKDGKGIILAACKSLEQNKKMSEFIFAEIDSSRLFAKIVSSLEKSTSDNIKKIQTEKQKLLAHYAYIFNEKGTNAILKDWIMNGFNQPAETVAELIFFLDETINHSIEHFPGK